MQQPEPTKTPRARDSLPPPVSAEPHCKSVAPSICLQQLSLLVRMYGESGGGTTCPDCKHLLHHAQALSLTLRCSGYITCFHRAQTDLCCPPLPYLLKPKPKDLHCRCPSILQPHLLHATVADAIVGPQELGHILQGQTGACSRSCRGQPAAPWQLWPAASAQHVLAQLTDKAPRLRRVALCHEAPRYLRAGRCQPHLPHSHAHKVVCIPLHTEKVLQDRATLTVTSESVTVLQGSAVVVMSRAPDARC